MTDNETATPADALAAEIRERRLSPHMIEMLTYVPTDATLPLPAGPTRAALIRRGLVWGPQAFGGARAGLLTLAGHTLAAKLRARP